MKTSEFVNIISTLAVLGVVWLAINALIAYLIVTDSPNMSQQGYLVMSITTMTLTGYFLIPLIEPTYKAVDRWWSGSKTSDSTSTRREINDSNE